MSIQDLRKEAVLFGITGKSEELVDRLLELDMELPDVQGDFYITVNGCPLCAAEFALTGASDATCEFSSLHESLNQREKTKAAFPAAVVAVVAGNCPDESCAAKAA